MATVYRRSEGMVQNCAVGWTRRAWPWLLLVALDIGGLCGFWAFASLPFVDLNGHAGVFALHKLLRQVGFESQYFVYAPHLGENALFRILGDVLADRIGPVAAVRALGSLPLIATPAAMFYARYRLYGRTDPYFPVMALILCFGYLTMMGLASYLIAIPLLLVVVAEWLILMTAADRHTLSMGHETVVALLTVLLCLTHGFAFLVFGFIAIVTAFSTGSRWTRLVRLRCLLPTVLLMGYSFWADSANPVLGAVGMAAPPLLYYDPIAHKLGLIFGLTLFSRTGVDLAIGVVVWIAVIAGVVVSNRAASADRPAAPTNKHVRALTVAAIATFLLFLAMPHAIAWFSFSDGRLLPVVLLLGLVAIDSEAFSLSQRKIAQTLAYAAAAIVVTTFLWAQNIFQAEAAGYDETFAAITPNTRVLFLPIDCDSRIFVQHSFSRYEGLLLAKKPVVPSEMWFEQGTAIYPKAANPILRLPREYVPASLHDIAWEHYRLQDWDFVIIRQVVEIGRPQTPATLVLESHHGSWWLYKVRAKHA